MYTSISQDCVTLFILSSNEDVYTGFLDIIHYEVPKMRCNSIIDNVPYLCSSQCQLCSYITIRKHCSHELNNSLATHFSTQRISALITSVFVTESSNFSHFTWQRTGIRSTTAWRACFLFYCCTFVSFLNVSFVFIPIIMFCQSTLPRCWKAPRYSTYKASIIGLVSFIFP